jgi:hypothetical protein
MKQIEKKKRKVEKDSIYVRALDNIDERRFVSTLSKLWKDYTKDKKELYRTDDGQPIFSADRFIFWLFKKYKI